jgi:hypothetical protein
VDLSFDQLTWAKFAFKSRLHELHENDFELFFDKLMDLRHPGYVAIRAQGSLGDQGADGLGLHDGRLYACYGPHVYDQARMRTKFWGDVSKALAKRSGQFSTFVFVHNDARGVHPGVPALLLEAQTRHSPLICEAMGINRMWREASRLERRELEDLLGCAIPVDPPMMPAAFSEVADLLDHLVNAVTAYDSDPLSQVLLPAEIRDKIDYNRLGVPCQRAISMGVTDEPLVHRYYVEVAGEMAAETAAQAFADHYREVQAACGDDPDAIMDHMEGYVLGNRRPNLAKQAAASAILAYFFARCDIFEVPPPGWRSDSAGAVA